MIFHTTKYSLYSKIVSKGLIHSEKPSSYEYDTGSINEILHAYKPEHIKEWMNRDQCLFFSLDNQYSLNQLLIDTSSYNQLLIGVNPMSLNTDKLFLASHTDAQFIWNETVDASFSTEYLGIDIEMLAKRYWNSIIPYSQLTKHMKPQDYEVLYFDHIHPKDLIILNPPCAEIIQLKNQISELETQFLSPNTIMILKNAINSKEHPLLKKKNSTLATISFDEVERTYQINMRNPSFEEYIPMIQKLTSLPLKKD